MSGAFQPAENGFFRFGPGGHHRNLVSVIIHFKVLIHFNDEIQVIYVAIKLVMVEDSVTYQGQTSIYHCSEEDQAQA